MAIPDKATGYGNSDNANVFRFYTDQALSAAVEFYCYDGASFPTTGTATTVLNDIFINGDSSKSMIGFCECSGTSTPGASWFPSTATGGGAVQKNRMKGATNFVTQQTDVPLSATSFCAFNMVIEIPSTATTSYDMDFDLEAKYSYTGTAPTPVWAYNDGTEGTPNWVNMTIDTHGIKHCRSGVSSPNLYANIPESGVELTAEGWATT